MPVVVDNNFSRDSYGMRSERLSAIQGNLASIQPVLLAPDQISNWADDCYDVYAELWTNSGVENDQSESATFDFNTKLELMEEEYQNAKMLAQSIYRDNQRLLKQFEFDIRFPDLRNDKIDKARKVIKTHQNHVADGVTTLLPAAIITRLTNATDAAEAAKWAQDKEIGEAGNALDLLTAQFDSDTDKLKELRSWWYAMMGKNDGRIAFAGMVNPSTGGYSGPVPVAPTNLTVDVATMVFSWDPLEEYVSSYILQSSIAGVEWETIYSGTDNFVKYMPPTTGLMMYRALGRNQNGLGVASSVMLYNHHELAPPENVSVAITSVPLGTIELTWSAVPLAQTYKIFYAKVDFGLAAPALTAFLNAGTVTVTSFEGTCEVGKRQYYFVRSIRLDGEIVSEPSAVVFVER